VEAGTRVTSRIDVLTEQGAVVTSGIPLIVQYSGKHPNHNWFEVARVRIAGEKVLRREFWCEARFLDRCR